MEGVFKDRRLNNSLDYLKGHYDRRGHVFSLVLAEGELLSWFFYELRYLSYIAEESIPFSSSPIYNKIEKDEWDNHSVKYLLMYDYLHFFIGGSRIILPETAKEYVHLPTLEKSVQLKQRIPESEWHCTGEVSRFLVSKERYALCADHVKRVCPQLTLSKLEEQKLLTLFLTCPISSINNNLKYLIFSLEKPLIRLLKIYGFPIIEIPEILDYHGEVCVGYFDIQYALELFSKEHPVAYDFYTSFPLRHVSQ